MRLRRAAIVIVSCFTLEGSAALAADRPIDGVKLVLRRKDTKEKLVFVSRDPQALFPAAGGADDPTTAGAVVELFSATGDMATHGAPAGTRWGSAAGPPATHTYSNPDAPGAGTDTIRKLVLKDGKIVKVIGRSTGLALTGPQGAVGIRITTGATRNCARFTAPARDQADVFVAKHAAASALADCSDAALSGTPPTTSTSVTVTTSTSVTTTTYVPKPCGDPDQFGGSAPACYGTCPAETPICASTPTGCACVAGSTPCGSASFFQCDGACPPDEACMMSLTLGCTCQFQGVPCAVSGLPICGGVCPNASDDCVGIFTPDGDGCICVPAGSTCHESCGGTCPGGMTCSPFVGSFCLCQ